MSMKPRSSEVEEDATKRPQLVQADSFDLDDNSSHQDDESAAESST